MKYEKGAPRDAHLFDVLLRGGVRPVAVDTQHLARPSRREVSKAKYAVCASSARFSKRKLST